MSRANCAGDEPAAAQPGEQGDAAGGGDQARAGAGGYQAARLQRLGQVLAEHHPAFCPEQYSNPDNPRSYATVAELFLECLGQIDCVIGPVGSGGSMCGTVTFLRSVLPECRAIGVDTHSSVLFGHADGPP